MALFSRTVARWDPVRVAGLALGVAVVLLIGAYGVAAVASSQVSTIGILAELALAAIACAGLLYAWRLGAGGLVE